jgi:hypothetical protein
MDNREEQRITRRQDTRTNWHASAEMKGPRMLIGDFNADLKDIGTLKDMVEGEGWADLGEAAQRWGGPACEFTCLGYNTHIPTRRDYMMVNQEALRLVRGFRVLHSEPFPVHAVLQVRLTAGEPDHTPFGKREPQSLYDALRVHCAAQPTAKHEEGDDEEKNESEYDQ